MKIFHCWPPARTIVLTHSLSARLVSGRPLKDHDTSIQLHFTCEQWQPVPPTITGDHGLAAVPHTA
jgi:hypothetical protein